MGVCVYCAVCGSSSGSECVSVSYKKKFVLRLPAVSGINYQVKWM